MLVFVIIMFYFASSHYVQIRLPYTHENYSSHYRLYCLHFLFYCLFPLLMLPQYSYNLLFMKMHCFHSNQANRCHGNEIFGRYNTGLQSLVLYVNHVVV